MDEAQEIHCHECDRYVQFKIDLTLSGNHVLECPNCGHEHCRVVKDGKITGDRWDTRNGPTFTITSSSSTNTSTWAVSITASATFGASADFSTGALWFDYHGAT